MINHRHCPDRALIALIATLRLREAARGLDTGEAGMLARYLVEVRRRWGRARRRQG